MKSDDKPTVLQVISYIAENVEPGRTVIEDYEFKKNLAPLGYEERYINEALSLFSDHSKGCPKLLSRKGNAYTVINSPCSFPMAHIPAEYEEKLEDILNKFKERTH